MQTEAEQFDEKPNQSTAPSNKFAKTTSTGSNLGQEYAPDRLKKKNPSQNDVNVKRDKKNKQNYYDKLRPEPGVNYFELYQQLQNKYEALMAQNIKQRDILKLRQETFVRREQKSKERQTELQEKLQQSRKTRGEDREDMENLNTLKHMIQEKIHKMKGETEKKLELKQIEYQTHIDDIISEYRVQLQEERKKNTNGVKQWNEKSKTLKENLRKATIKAVELDDLNNQLLKENQRLKIQYQAQADDHVYLEKINSKVTAENEKAKEELKKLENDVLAHKRIAEAVQAHHQAITSAEEHDEYSVDMMNVPDGFTELTGKEEKLTDTINRLKKMVEAERRSMKAVKAAHAASLSERSELEALLRQTIEIVKRDIRQYSKRSVSPTKFMVNEEDSTVDFSVRERQKVVDLMLSKEEVLMQLYPNAQ